MAELEVIGSVSDVELDGTSSVDYATAHEAGTASFRRDDGQFLIAGQRLSVGKYWVYRAGIYFDTSDLPDDATISAGVITLTAEFNAAEQDFNVTIVNGDDLDDPAVDADYGDLFNDTTALANTQAGSGWVVGTPKEFTLTSGGRDKISLTGTTKFGIRSSRDIGSNTPASGVDEYIRIHSADTTDSASYKPKILITYTRTFIPKVIIG